ncbi:hypothetical protein AO385_1085 [Moraxella catarrhalis]|uniref:Uncharacterized protein n=1 Tax=Moraxella catarrhalis TaxID=480 RepID=A0A198UQ45_MORCA|nr:hypothetical protein AO383_1601 [Moraxella catarrhalis]OAU98394.1 hypothetical protein AO384_0155 [Moraxella catarrhalis]OAV01399.1 hypothetical protein AO385_1085 [Moraxella catarrhalis]
MGVKIFNDRIKLGYLNALFFGQKLIAVLVNSFHYFKQI